MTEPNALDEITARLAEEITKRWASFDRSPRRSEIRDTLRNSIATAIVNQLVITTDEEMRGVGAKW